jgi:hypothetical protein
MRSRRENFVRARDADMMRTCKLAQLSNIGAHNFVSCITLSENASAKHIKMLIVRCVYGWRTVFVGNPLAFKLPPTESWQVCMNDHMCDIFELPTVKYWVHVTSYTVIENHQKPRPAFCY